MGTFHHFADQVRVVDDDGRTWSGSEALFERDYGVSVPDLPPDLTERVYEQGKRHALMRDHDVIDGGLMPWPEGDAIIDALQDALAQQQARQSLSSEFDLGETIAQMLGGG